MAAGVGADICLHSFVDSFQEETLIMVKHYKEFIQPYPPTWFEGLSFDPPSSADGDTSMHVPVCGEGEVVGDREWLPSFFSLVNTRVVRTLP
ncbi:hypothetical protein LIER_17680 [Lithospermum erythrorhizon]|uniref:Uncharacterized protein n=1 Tax=Lithospermum erythrorhizon TaxID=34254 RepID=A0AAV3QB89_LITER